MSTDEHVPDILTLLPDTESALSARLAGATDHHDLLVEEHHDEHSYLFGARNAVSVQLRRHDFTLPDGQTSCLWAVYESWVHHAEDADEGEFTIVYPSEKQARARWTERVAAHRDAPPQARHPEGLDSEDDEEDEDVAECPGLDVRHCDHCGSTSAPAGWMSAAVGVACDIDCFDAMSDGPGEHAVLCHPGGR